MDAEDSTINNGGDIETIENLSTEFPGIGASIFALALVVEAVDLSDLSRFVVAAKESDFVGISCFEKHQNSESLDAVVPAINKIAHEDVTRGRHFPTTLEEFEQVEELAVNVTADSDGRTDWLDIGFFEEDVFDHLAKTFEVFFGQVLALFHFFNPFVEINRHWFFSFFVFPLFFFLIGSF